MTIEMNVVEAFHALGDTTRFRIVQMLASCCCNRAAIHEDGGVEGATAGDICCSVTGAERITSTVSHHLAELERAGLITRTRRGKAVVCALRPEALQFLSTTLGSMAIGESQ